MASAGYFPMIRIFTGREISVFCSLRFWPRAIARSQVLMADCALFRLGMTGLPTETVISKGPPSSYSRYFGIVNLRGLI